MHELSIAQALLELVQQHAPAGTRVQSLLVRVGPMRGIEPQPMQWAWQAATAGTELAESNLVVEQLPWRLHCPDCGREWVSEELYAHCSCGGEHAHPMGGDELSLVSLEVED